MIFRKDIRLSNRLAKPALLLLCSGFLMLTSCGTWMDDAKIRRDKNTLVNPTIWELQDLEAKERKKAGITSTSNSKPKPTSSSTYSKPIKPTYTRKTHSAPPSNYVEPPLPDTAQDLGVVPMDSIPELGGSSAGNNNSYNPELLEELSR